MRLKPIKTSEKKFFRMFLEIIRSIPPFNKLRTKELDVLAQILYYNNKYKQLPLDDRLLILFNKKTKIKMRDDIGISNAVFDMYMSNLRKHNVLGKENTLSPFLESLFFDNEFEITFKFEKNDNSGD